MNPDPEHVRSIGTSMIEAADLLSSPATRPGGGFAVVRRQADLDSDEHRTRVELWRDGRHDVVEGDGGDQLPRWAPDGSRLSLQRKVGDFAQVVLVEADVERSARTLTSFPAGVTDHRWSPDGTRLAVVTPLPTRELPPTDDPVARWRRRPIEVREQLHKLDGIGFRRDLCQSLYVVDVASGEATPVVVGTHQVQTIAWSPDGRRIAFTAVRHSDAGRTPTMPLFAVGASGGEPERLAAGLDSVGAIAWSGDGLAVVGHREHGAGSFGRLFLVDEHDPEAEPDGLFGELDASVGGAPFGNGGAGPAWLGDGRLAWTIARAGVYEVVVADPRSDQHDVVSGGGAESSPLLDAQDGLLTVVRRGEDDFDQVLHGDPDGGLLPGTPSQPRPDNVPACPMEPVEYLVAGVTVPGWIATPDGGGPHPLLLDVHGGPHAMWGPTLSEVTWYRHALVELGWAILALDPVGSEGRGQAHASGAVGRWGEADGAQWLGVLDQLVEEGFADPDRLAVTGYSYGGFMTNWLAATSDRFRAAVAGGCISDLVSYAGTADLGPMFLHAELGAEVLEDPDRYRRLSPLTQAKNLTAPLLLLHGESDQRTPLGQAEQLFTALHRLGREVELVVYPDATHALRRDGRPSHRLDYGERLVRWLATHVPPRTVGDPGEVDEAARP